MNHRELACLLSAALPAGVDFPWTEETAARLRSREDADPVRDTAAVRLLFGPDHERGAGLRAERPVAAR